MQPATKRWIAGALAGLGVALSGQAVLAELPAGQIHLYVDSSAGGGKDILARFIGEELGERLDRIVVVEAKPGAGGLVAGQAVTSSRPDGLTLLFTGMNSTVSPNLYSDVAFDPKTDLRPVGAIMSLPFILVVPPDYPAQNLEEFNAYLRENPDEAKVATAGSTTTVAAALYMQQAGIEHEFIAYPGGAPAITSLLTGEMGIFFGDMANTSAYIESGQVRAIAISSPKRSSLMPDIPTATEQGWPDYVVTSWYGILAPGETPDETVNQIHDTLAEIIADPAVIERLGQLGGEPFELSVEDFTNLYLSDLQRWKDVIERGNITP